LSTESDLSRKGKARRISYARAPRTAQELKVWLRARGHPDVIALQVEDLLEAFRLGLRRYVDELELDSVRAAHVRPAVRKWLIDVGELPEA
jgi:hypothetical protein